MTEKIDSFHCEKCNYSTDVKQRYELHLQSKKHMNGNVEYECKYCNYKCTYLHSFNRHNDSKKHKVRKTWWPIFKRTELKWKLYHEQKDRSEPSITDQKYLKLFNGMDWDISPNP
jgi:hypothetical protein